MWEQPVARKPPAAQTVLDKLDSDEASTTKFSIDQPMAPFDRTNIHREVNKHEAYQTAMRPLGGSFRVQ